MFEETYTRIRHQEHIKEAEYARQIRASQRPTRSTQVSGDHTTAPNGFNRRWWLPILRPSGTSQS